MIQTVWTLREEGVRKGRVTPTPYDAATRKTAPFQSSLLLRLLANRGITTPEEVLHFLYADRTNLFDPFLMKGMNQAVERIKKAARLGEKVLVHGDYDVDGITGAAILGLTLEKLKISFQTFLPERAKDGYGVSRKAIQQAKREGARLFITVDCGISALEQIREVRQAGIDTIVLDHHQLPATGLPPANAILNPIQETCAYPFKDLSAGGLAFKLAQALLGSEAFDYFDLVTLSTVADLAPLRGENRILVKEGLRLLSQRKRIGIRALSQAASLRVSQIKTDHVSFMLAPRINASGRMSSALTALRLLLTENEKEATSLAQILEQENRQRQQEERRVVNEAVQQVERTVNFARDRVIVVAQEGWHQGVLGITASRLVERYHRPALVIAIQNGKGKGSGRSIRNFHLVKALEAAKECLEEFGGHEQAAGFNINEDQIPFLRERLNAYARTAYSPEIFLKAIDIDLEITISDLTPRFIKELDLLEPFGIGNPRPVFLTRGLRVKKIIPVRRDGFETRPCSYFQLWATDGNLTYEVALPQHNPIPFDFEKSSSFDLVYTVNQKCWNGEERIVLEAKDAKLPS